MRKHLTESKKSANNYALIFNAIHAVGVSSSGEAIGRDASFITRLKANDKKISLDEFVTLLGTWNLELTDGDADKVSIDRILFKALSELSHKQINNATTPAEEKTVLPRQTYEALLVFARIGVATLGKTL
jgi:hypothetical protein